MMEYNLIISLTSFLILITNAVPVPKSSEDGLTLQDDSFEPGLIEEKNEETQLLNNEESEESIASEALNVKSSAENNYEALDENVTDEELIKDSTDEDLAENESDEKIEDDGIDGNNDDENIEDDVSEENIIESNVNEGVSVGGESEAAVNDDGIENITGDEIVKGDSQYSKEDSILLEDETLILKHETEKGGTNLDAFDAADDLDEDYILQSNTKNDDDNNNNGKGDDELESDDDESKAGLLISVKDKDLENSEEDDDDGEYVTEIVEFTEIVGGNYSEEVDAINEENVALDQKGSSYELSINADKEPKLVGTEVIIEETKLDDEDEKSMSGHHRTTTYSNDESRIGYSEDDSYEDSSSSAENKNSFDKITKEKYKKWKDTYQYSITKDFAFKGNSEPKALRQSLIIKTGGLPYKKLPNYIKQDLLKRVPLQNDEIQNLQNQFGKGAIPSIDSINNALEQILTVKTGSFPEPGAWCCPNSMTLKGFTCHNGINEVPAQYFNHLTYFKFKDLMCQTVRPAAEILGLMSRPIKQMMPDPGLGETPEVIQEAASRIESGIIPSASFSPKMGVLSKTNLDALSISGIGIPGVVPGAGPVLYPFAEQMLKQAGNPGAMNGDFMMGIQPWPVQGDLNGDLLSKGHLNGPGGPLVDDADSWSGSGGIKFVNADSTSNKFAPDSKIQKEILEGEVIPWPVDSATGFEKILDIMVSRNEVPILVNKLPSIKKYFSNNLTPNLSFRGISNTGQNSLKHSMLPLTNLIPKMRTDSNTGSKIPLHFNEGLKYSSFNDSSRPGTAGLIEGVHSTHVTSKNNINTLNSQRLMPSANANIKTNFGSSILNTGIGSPFINSMNTDHQFSSKANRFNQEAGDLLSMILKTQSRDSFNSKTGSQFASITDNSKFGSDYPVSVNLLTGLATSSLVNDFPREYKSSLIQKQSNQIPEESLSWGGTNSNSQFAGSLFHSEGEWVEDAFDSQELLDHQNIDWNDEGLESKDYAWVLNYDHIYDNLIQDDFHPKQKEMNNFIVPNYPTDYTLQDERLLLKVPERLQVDMLINPFSGDNNLYQDYMHNIIPGNADIQNGTDQQQCIKDMNTQSLQMDNSFIAPNNIDSQGLSDPSKKSRNSDTHSKYREGKSSNLPILLV